MWEGYFTVTAAPGARASLTVRVPSVPEIKPLKRWFDVRPVQYRVKWAEPQQGASQQLQLHDSFS